VCRPGGSRGTAPIILNPRTRPIWMVIFTSRLLCPSEQIPRYQSNKALDGPQRCFWRFGEKQVCCPCRKWDDSSVARPVVWLSPLLMDKYWGCENLLPWGPASPESYSKLVRSQNIHEKPVTKDSNMTNTSNSRSGIEFYSTVTATRVGLCATPNDA